MLSFQDFDKKVLSEAVNTPVEFYMTDETDIPKKIAAAFEINGNQYGMSLTLTKYEKIYELDFYRIVNTAKRRWTFHSSKDVLKCFSTVLEFMNASVPFVGQKMDGIILNLPVVAKSVKYVSFLERIVKKTHVDRYKPVNFQRSSNAPAHINFMFFIRKTMKPEYLFTSQVFKKNFKFSDFEEVAEVIAEVEPYKPQPRRASLRPSQDDKFDSMSFEIEVGDELTQKLEADIAAYEQKVANNEINPDLIKLNIEARPSKFQSSYFGGTYSKWRNNPQGSAVPAPVVLADIMPGLYKDLTGDYQTISKTMKMSIEEIRDLFDAAIPYLDKTVFKALQETKLIKKNGKASAVKSNEKVWRSLLKLMRDVQEEDLRVYNENKKNFVSADSGAQTANAIDLSVKPESNVQAFLKDNTTTVESTDGAKRVSFAVSGEQISKKQNAITTMPNVMEWAFAYSTAIDSNLPEHSKMRAQAQAVRDYTGGGYHDINTAFRRLYLKNDPGLFAASNADSIKALNFYNHFMKHAPKLEEAIWVYRNTSLAEYEKAFQLGKDFIDAAPMSTSISSNLTFATGGISHYMRMKIYLPAGTRCIPILNKSLHPTEYEVILPPLSAIRITEKYKGQPRENSTSVVGMYIGNGLKDIERKFESLGRGDLNDKAKALQEQSDMSDKQNQKPIEKAGDKWETPLPSGEELEKLAQAVKDKEIKLGN